VYASARHAQLDAIELVRCPVNTAVDNIDNSLGKTPLEWIKHDDNVQMTGTEFIRKNL